MSRKKIVTGLLIVGGVLGMGWYNLSSIARHTVELHLQLYGASVYEHHAKTGRWPTQPDDLERTSLAQKSPHWRTMLDNGAFVILWPKDLPPDAKQNAGILLAYHDKRILGDGGRVWVCWGDLRTESIPIEDLHARLQAK